MQSPNWIPHTHKAYTYTPLADCEMRPDEFDDDEMRPDEFDDDEMRPDVYEPAPHIGN